MFGRIATTVLTACLLCGTWQADAQQQFDPRPVLSTLITAFQQCGPPQAYTLLSPFLFTLVSQQTNNMGCYAAMAAAGRITDMQVIDSAMFPAGPLYIVRVTHVAGSPVDWFIGFDKFSSQVIYLTFQSGSPGSSPSVAAGADRNANLGLVKPPSKRDDDASSSDDDPTKPDDEPKPSNKKKTTDSCKKFPQMCP